MSTHPYLREMPFFVILLFASSFSHMTLSQRLMFIRPLQFLLPCPPALYHVYCHKHQMLTPLMLR